MGEAELEISGTSPDSKYRSLSASWDEPSIGSEIDGRADFSNASLELSVIEIGGRADCPNASLEVGVVEVDRRADSTNALLELGVGEGGMK
jgi:hypothetical protein